MREINSPVYSGLPRAAEMDYSDARYHFRRLKATVLNQKRNDMVMYWYYEAFF